MRTEDDTTDDEMMPNQGPADRSQRRYTIRVRNPPRFYRDEVQ